MRADLWFIGAFIVFGAALLALENALGALPMILGWLAWLIVHAPKGWVFRAEDDVSRRIDRLEDEKSRRQDRAENHDERKENREQDQDDGGPPSVPFLHKDKDGREA